MDTEDLRATLHTIHKLVFRNFTYATDQEQYSMVEKWVMPETDYNRHRPFTGDCEDFALACRKLCREDGIDNSRLVYCQTELGGGHCVLEVDGWILDNRFDRLKNRDDIVGYKWIALSGYNSGDPWHKITNSEVKES